MAKPESSSALRGLTYGLLPHAGCIAFIVASVLGVTVLTQAFKPLMLSPYFFYGLVAMSLAFATASSLLYLRSNGLLSLAGARRKWRYMSLMYGSTVGVNALMFLFVFPMFANVSAPAAAEGSSQTLSTLRLQVQIPCSGHATLISDELKTLPGVNAVKFSLPNVFDVTYDAARTSRQDVLGLEVFKTYAATVFGGS